jgi:hypothetical protein
MKIVPVLAASVLVPEITSNGSRGLLLIGFGMTLVSSLMAVLNDVLSYSERAEKHSATFLNFGELSRQITYFLVVMRSEGELKGFYMLCEHKYNTYQQLAPDVPLFITTQLSKDMRDTTKRESLHQQAITTQVCKKKKINQKTIKKLSRMDVRDLRLLLRDSPPTSIVRSSSPERREGLKSQSNLSVTRGTQYQNVMNTATKNQVLESLLFDRDIDEKQLQRFEYNQSRIRFKSGNDHAVDKVATELGLNPPPPPRPSVV